MTQSARGWLDTSGKPIRPEASYTVATIDYLYFGGSNFTFKSYDPAPKDTGLDWRAPVLEWTKKQHSSDAHPIEAALTDGARPDKK